MFLVSLLKRSDHTENEKLLKKKFVHFSRRQKNKDFSSYNTFAFRFAEKENLFQEHIVMELITL